MEFEYLELIFFEFQVVDLLIWHLKPKATEEKSIVVHISVNRIFLTSNISEEQEVILFPESWQPEGDKISRNRLIERETIVKYKLRTSETPSECLQIYC